MKYEKTVWEELWTLEQVKWHSLFLDGQTPHYRDVNSAWSQEQCQQVSFSFGVRQVGNKVDVEKIMKKKLEKLLKNSNEGDIKTYYKTATIKLVWYSSESRSVVSNFLQPNGLYSPWNSPGQNPGVK